jgi:hypothetical protein
MRKVSTLAFSLGVALVMSACGSGEPTEGSSSALPRPHGCSTLSESDVGNVAGLEVQKVDIASDSGRGIECSSMFGGGAGDIVAVVTQRLGGAKTLKRIRARAVHDFGADHVRPDGNLDAGAFVARNRMLVFRHGERVVTVESGYSRSSGLPVLTVAQLERLARMVGERL